MTFSYIHFYNHHIQPNINRVNKTHFQMMKYTFTNKEGSYETNPKTNPKINPKTNPKKDKNSSYTQTNLLCHKCNTYSIVQRKHELSCDNCGYSNFLTDISTTHDGSGTLYKRQKYFIRMLSSLEPISNIPHYDAKETSITLQEAKKKYGIYYMDIYCLLHSITKPIINKREKKTLLEMFDVFVSIYETMRCEEKKSYLKNRKNFLHYGLVLCALLIMISREDCIPYIILPSACKQEEQRPSIELIIQQMKRTTTLYSIELLYDRICVYS